MGFRFPLKALLRVRRIFEQQERRRLEAIARRLVYAQKQLAALKKARVEEAGLLVRGMKEGMTGAELHFHAARAAARERLVSLAVQAVENLNRQRQAQLAAYKRARQDVEVIERLRERQLSAFRRGQARKDQQQANDMFLVLSQSSNDGQELPGQPANLSSEEEA